MTIATGTIGTVKPFPLFWDEASAATANITKITRGVIRDKDIILAAGMNPDL